MQNVHFTPPQLSRIFDVNASTIKRWVDKGILESQKTPGGHRRITKKQLEQFIRSYPKLVGLSYVIGRIQKREKSNISYKKYYNLLFNNEYTRAKKELMNHITKGVEIYRVLESIIVPTLKQIGDYWECGKITVLDEHRMSFVIRQHITIIGELINDPKKDSEMFILACVPGENHEIGLQLVSVILKACGYRVCILGINISPEQLVEAIKKTKATNVGLSKMYNTRMNAAKKLKKVINYCNRKDIDLYYGGSGWSEKEIGEINSVLKSDKYINSLAVFRRKLRCN